jgi:hypothetical protein
VCAMVAVFVQQTVSPWLMVTGSGVKLKLAMVIIVSPDEQPPAGRVSRVEAWLDAGSTTSTASNASESPLPFIPVLSTITRRERIS